MNIKFNDALVTAIKKRMYGKKKGTLLSDCPVYLHRHGINGKIK